MNFLGKYITKEGKVKSLLYKVSHNIENPALKHVFIENVLKPISHSIMIIRDESDLFDDGIQTASRLKTQLFDIDIEKDGFEYIKMPIPSFGGVMESINSNVNIMTQIQGNKALSYIDSTSIKLIPLDDSVDSTYMIINTVTNNGLSTNVYQLQFKFDSTWSTTCPECSSSMTYLKNEIVKISDEIFCNKNAPFKVEGNVVADFLIDSVDIVKTQLKSILNTSFNNARVEDFNVVDVTNTIGNYDK